MHSLHFMRRMLNSSDISYAGKLFFKLTCFGNLSPVSLLSWDVCRDTYLRESRMDVVFPCWRGRPVSKTRGRPNRPRGGRCHIFVVCVCVCVLVGNIEHCFKFYV